MNDRVRGRGWAAPTFLLVVLACATALASVAVAGTPDAAMARPKDRGGIRPQVVGGHRVDKGEYPFVVAVLDVTYGRDAFERQFCAGSLIDPSHVLTAAHCVAFRGFNRKDARVIVGRTELRSHEGVGRRITRVQVHPGYKPRTTHTNENDVAVLTLDQPVLEFAPIQLPASGDESLEQAGQPSIIAGWGSMTQDRVDRRDPPPRFPSWMREAEVAVVSDDDCREAYNGNGIVEAVMLCAGEDGKDTCQGDSGGPIFVAVDGGFRQIGIVSFGFGCADPDYPGVYTQVSAPAIASFIAGAVGDVSSG